jgi:tRNA A37 threonylcarbamoyladenosine dehydratase
MYRYEELFERNFPLVSQEEQDRIKISKIGIIGIGAMSFVGELLIRLGCMNIIFFDKDWIEAHNINHQVYNLTLVGKNKAEALKELLQQINPLATIVAIPEFLTEENFEEIATTYLSDLDFIIDGIDPVPYLNVSRKVAELCEKKKVRYLYPLDVGNGALLITDPELFLELTKEGETPIDKLMNMFQKMNVSQKLGIQLKTIIGKLAKREIAYYPQTVISATTASVITVSAFLQMVKGKKPPRVIYVDFVENIFWRIE